DRLADAGKMKHVCRAKDIERQIARPHATRRRARAQIAELVPVRSVSDEVDAGRGVGVGADTGDVDALAAPEVEELATESIVADPRHVRAARAGWRREHRADRGSSRCQTRSHRPPSMAPYCRDGCRRPETPGCLSAGPRARP